MDKILATAKPPKESLAAINNFGIGEFHSKENVSFYKESQGCLPSQDGIVIPMDNILATEKHLKESLAYWLGLLLTTLGIGEFHFL